MFYLLLLVYTWLFLVLVGFFIELGEDLAYAKLHKIPYRPYMIWRSDFGFIGIFFIAVFLWPLVLLGLIFRRGRRR